MWWKLLETPNQVNTLIKKWNCQLGEVMSEKL